MARLNTLIWFQAYSESGSLERRIGDLHVPDSEEVEWCRKILGGVTRRALHAERKCKACAPNGWWHLFRVTLKDPPSFPTPVHVLCVHYLLRRLKLILRDPSARCCVCLSSVQEEARGHLEAAGAEADHQARGGETAGTVPRDALSIGIGCSRESLSSTRCKAL